MNNRSIKFAKVFVAIFLLISVIFPLITVFLNISFSDIAEIFSTDQFRTYLMNSLTTTIVATILSVGIAFLLAWLINRSNIRYKSLFSVLFTLPMLIPSISHGMGLVLLFGDNGLITNLTGLNIGLYGPTGIVIGSILYSFPVAFLMLTDIFHYEDYTTYESAEVLGVSKLKQFWVITLPNMKMPLISSMFAVFTMVFTDYGVPLSVGGKTMTLSVYMYREVIGLLNFSKGAIIGAILLIPAVIAFIIDLKNESDHSESTVARPFDIKPNRKRDVIAYVICAITLVLIALPLAAFIILSFVTKYPIDMSFSLVNVKNAFSLGVGSYLLNSITIALLTALIGIAISFFTAFLTARSKKTFSNLTLHLIAMLSLAIPGIVLGLGYVLFFNGTAIYGTIAILVLVNIVHFFASPYLLAYNSLTQFNESLEDVSMTLGISKWHMLKDVYIPCTQDTIIEMFSYMFVNAMVTISAVSFLANLRNMPLSLLIPQFDSQSLIEATAFISVLILITNVVVKGLVYMTKRYFTKRGVA